MEPCWRRYARRTVPLLQRGGNMRCRKGCPCSIRAKAACIHGLPACTFGRRNRTKAPLRVTVDRDLRMALARPCRYSLPLAFCAENAAPAPPAVRNIFNTTLLQNDEGRSIASRSLQSRRVLPIVQTSFQTAEWPCIIASFACTISARAIRPPM